MVEGVLLELVDMLKVVEEVVVGGDGGTGGAVGGS